MLAQLSVLLIDENEDERELYAAGLPGYGFRVRCLPSLDGLEHAVEEGRPDTILMNLRLGDDETWAPPGAAVRRLGERARGAADGVHQERRCEPHSRNDKRVCGVRRETLRAGRWPPSSGPW